MKSQLLRLSLVFLLAKNAQSEEILKLSTNEDIGQPATIGEVMQPKVTEWALMPETIDEAARSTAIERSERSPNIEYTGQPTPTELSAKPEAPEIVPKPEIPPETPMSCYAVRPLKDEAPKSDWKNYEENIERCQPGEVIHFVWIQPNDVSRVVSQYCDIRYSVLTYDNSLYSFRRYDIVCLFSVPRKMRRLIE